MRIAIQSDDQLLTSGRRQSFSDAATAYLTAHAHDVVPVDVHRTDALDEIATCDGFMWWFAHLPYPRRLGMRVAQAVEHGLGLPTFPSWRTVWHFDDKVAQYYLLKAAGIPLPRTWILWKDEHVREFTRTATFPMVLKLSGGIISENVARVNDAREVEYWTRRLFGPGVTALEKPARLSHRNVGARLRAAVRLMRSGDPPRQGNRSDLQRDYMYLQEFLTGNEGDTRVTVVGNRAFAYRRFNRPNDFRASGSGLRDNDPSKIDLEAVRLALRVATTLGMQSCAVDVLRGEGGLVINEISYYYEAWIVAECPGHWEVDGDPSTAELRWVAGSVDPRDAIVADFVELVGSRRSHIPAAFARPRADMVPR